MRDLMNTSDIAKQLGMLGGEKTKATRDPDYYRCIGASGGQAGRGKKKPRKEAVEKGGDAI
jgi:general stress protein YciG